MIDINELRRLAKEQQWIGRWYDAGCETLMAERSGEHEEVAHPMPIGLVPYLVAVQPAAISELLDRLEAAESEAIEQARLNGMGAERELALMAKLEAAEKERSADSETPTIDWQSSCEMWKRAHEKVDRIASELQDTVHKQAQQLSRWEASYNAVCDERDAIAKNADKAYMLLRWAETEMRYAGWGYRAADNHGRTDVFEAVVGFLK